MQRAGVLAGGCDGEIADIVGFDACAIPEGSFDFALALRVFHHADAIFESALGDPYGFS